MEEARVISLSELLQLGSPLTGAASLSLHAVAPRGSHPSSSPSPKLTVAEADIVPERQPFGPRTLQPLNTPAVLVGSLGLFGDDGSHASCGSRNHCFSFSDGSSRVCCAVLDVDVTVLGGKICALAWNFLPLPRGGGFVEIIRWSLPEPELRSGHSPLPSVPPHFPQLELEDISRARSCAWGVLVSVSPVFSVPFTDQNGGCERKRHREATGSEYSVGFLAEVATCKCDSCTKATALKDLHRCLQARNVHSFRSPLFVYFRGPSSSWRPILSMLLGNVLTVSNLRKKYVSAGGGESLIFATTERTIVYRGTKPADNWFTGRMAHPKKGQLGSYSGVVTGIFKKGMVVELDKKDVWLLCTDHLLDLPHSLRVGAVISIKNVHFIRPNFSWTRILLLGSCIKTTIKVKSFSLVDTRSHFLDRSHCLLWDFIDSLPFSARFWVLLLISSFQQKFAGIFSDKEILGSRKKEGLVQTYCMSSFSSSMLECQPGIFEDFCKHDRCSCRDSLNNVPLKLVVPMANFVTKCKTIWLSKLWEIQVDAETNRDNSSVYQSHCEGKCHHRMIRQIISSEELGLVLVGSLQVSMSSGRLQLVDSTGGVDVVIPDLSPNFDQQIIHEVKDYKLVIEGFPVQLDPIVFHQGDPLSCRSILLHFQRQEDLNGLMIYVHSYVRNLRCVKTSPLPSIVRADDVMGNSGGDLHLLLVTHKFPQVQNFPGDSSVLSTSSAFAEAIFLPYNLILLGKDQHIQHAEFSESKECADDIPCLITFSGITYQGYIVPCNLCHRDGNPLDTLITKHGGQRVLLEFNSGSIEKYQLLCIGTYYILKSKVDLPDGTEGHIKHLDSSKELITSQSCLWSLKFSVGSLMLPCMSGLYQLSGTSGIEDDASHFEVLCQSEKLFHHCAGMINENLDACLSLSNRAIEPLKKTKSVENCLTKVHKTLGEVFSVSSFISMSLRLSGSVNPQGRLPEGNLISVRGTILDVHICHHGNCGNKAEWSSKCLGECTICIHVHEGHLSVKVRGILHKSIYPLGMGPGANATFYRVLMMSDSERHSELMIVPVSFIVVNYVEQLEILHCSRILLPLSKSFTFSSNLEAQSESLHMVSSRLISESIYCSDNTKVRLHCRVTGTFILLLEEQAPKPKKLRASWRSKAPPIRISLAGLILDDGSSLCCCWANNDRAEMLVQLQETAFQSLVSGHGISRLVRNNKRHISVGSLLKKMLKKHHRITIRNYGAKIDSSSIEATFSGDSNKSFTNLEEDVLRFIILNARNGPNLDIIGYMLNHNELPWADEKFLEVDFAEQSMEHFWAEEVSYSNPLIEGRNLIKELLPR